MGDELTVSVADPFHWIGHDPLLLRLIRSWGSPFGLGYSYVALTGCREQLWTEAMRSAPIAFRWFGHSVSLEELDLEFNHFDPWTEVKDQYQIGDKIWPFAFNVHTLAMRAGFVLVRNRRHVTGLVTVLS